MNENSELTVLMPCLNEAKTLGACIEKIHSSCRNLGIRYEILVSDNGSTDGSIDLAQKMGARVTHARMKGYGAALMHGFNEAQGRYVLFADADDTYDFTEIKSFWEQVQSDKNPVVIGTRLKGTIHDGAMPLLHRYLGTPVLTFLIRNLYSIPISDCNSGMRLLKKTTYKELQMKSPGMEFASEMLVKLGLRKVPVKEIPIHLWPDRRGRAPHLKTWRDGWRHLRFILMYAPGKILILPGLLAWIAGVIGVFAFIQGPLHIGSMLFDYHSQLAFATLGLVGMSMWSFGQLIRFFSHVSEFQNISSRGFYMSMSLEKKLLISLGLMAVGAFFGGEVVMHWIQNDFANIAEIHKFVACSFLFLTGFMSSLLAATLFVFEYE